MRKLSLAVMLFMTVTLTACGGDHHEQPVFVAQILSDPNFDGDIEVNSSGTTTTVTQPAPGSVFAGVDPVTGNEFRAFLDFPLTGSVPGNAGIVSATLDIFIDNVNPDPVSGTVPIRIDLVNFQPPTLLRDGSDFDRSILPVLASMTFSPPILVSDQGHHVVIDVTPLMVEAQNQGLPDFQIRILEDFTASLGLIEIDDTTADLAPLLTVNFI